MWGLFFLIGGSLSDITIPMFIGWVIDNLQDGNYDEVGRLCLYMLAVVAVS